VQLPAVIKLDYVQNIHRALDQRHRSNGASRRALRARKEVEMMQTRTLIGMFSAALVVGTLAFMTLNKPTRHGTVEISAVPERNWTVEVSEVR
jgi:hypothetical protein